MFVLIASHFCSRFTRSLWRLWWKIRRLRCRRMFCRTWLSKHLFVFPKFDLTLKLAMLHWPLEHMLEPSSGLSPRRQRVWVWQPPSHIQPPNVSHNRNFDAGHVKKGWCETQLQTSRSPFHSLKLLVSRHPVTSKQTSQSPSPNSIHFGGQICFVTALLNMA